MEVKRKGLHRVLFWLALSLVVLGFAFLENRLPLDFHILLVSGRASFEILQKALAGRIPIICAVSAPSSLAVDFARESGQTLVGFLRGETMNVYACAERIERSTGRPALRWPGKRRTSENAKSD